ncbi:MAG: PEGA domain-containing protein [Thermoplasmata archaeon]|nr:PEGA domain-containing protein [Thermoplasmata archaeon]
MRLMSVLSLLVLFGLILPAFGTGIAVLGEDETIDSIGCNMWSPGNGTGDNLTLSGLVYDPTSNASENGISGATVTIWGGCYILDYCENGEKCYCDRYWWEPVNLTTDESGDFEVLLPEGYYSITVEKEGYTTANEWLELYNDTYIEVEISKLTAVMAGSVVDGDGNPVAGAWISLSSWNDDIYWRECGNGVEWSNDTADYRYYYGTTGDDGTFTVYAMPGVYRLYLYAYGHSSIEDEIELFEGRNEMTFALEALSAPVVSGWVVDGANGNGVAGAFVELYPSDYYWEEMKVLIGEEDRCYENGTVICPDGGSLYFTAETDESGYFEVTLDGLACWQWIDVVVTADGYESTMTSVYVEERAEVWIELFACDPEPVPGDLIREYEYEWTDRDSDGNPDYMHIYEAYTTSDGVVVYEYEYEMVDRDDDGNPERVYEREYGTYPGQWRSADDDGTYTDLPTNPIDPDSDPSERSTDTLVPGDGKTTSGEEGRGADANEARLDSIVPVAVALGLAFALLGAMVLWTGRVH